MMTNRSDGKRRLNPFAFPAETNVRFTLLIVTAVTLAFNSSILLRFALDPAQANTFADPISAPALDAPNDTFFGQAGEELSALADRSGQHLLLPTIMVGAVFGLAAVLYGIHPLRVRRRKGLRPLPRDKDAGFQREIRFLARRVEVAPPRVELGSEKRSSSGQAFGLRPRYVIGLGKRTRLLWRKDAATFHALVLHELAHLRNGDVGRTYFAEALWTAVFGLAVVPLCIALGGVLGHNALVKGLTGDLDAGRVVTKSLPTLAVFVAQVGATLAVAYAIWASLLRAREVYADWRAVQWGVEAPLTNVLKRSAAKEVDEGSKGWRRLHPTAQMRLATLRDPSGLFRVTHDLPLIVGILLGILTASLVGFVLPGAIGIGARVAEWATRLGETASEGGSIAQLRLVRLIVLVSFPLLAAALTIPILGLGYLVAGTVGLQVQREAVADLAYGRRGLVPYLRLLSPSALVAVGLEIGFAIVPFAQLSPLGLLLGDSLVHPLQLALPLPWMLGATALTWLGLAYTRFFARRLLGRHLNTAPPKGKRRTLTGAASGVFWVLYAPLVVARLGGLYAPGISAVVISSVMLLLGLFVYGAAFGGTWVMVQAAQVLRRSRCPACQQGAGRRAAVGYACTNCGRELAPWLLTAPAPG